jgi:putative ATP-binding cassette transporter
MRLLSFLLRTSRRMVIFALVASLLGAISSVGLIALSNIALRSARLSTTTLVWGFAGLGFGTLLTRVISRVLSTSLAQRAIFDIRMQMIHRMLAAPLLHLETLGAPRLLATLTDDVLVVSQALPVISVLCANIATVVGCLIYLGWLSWSVLLIVLGFLSLGIGTYKGLIARALHRFKCIREEQDTLFSHFRAVIDGIKELKLHSHRRALFLSQSFQPTTMTLRHETVIGNALHDLARSWGELLFFLIRYPVPCQSHVLTISLRWPIHGHREGQCCPRVS